MTATKLSTRHRGRRRATWPLALAASIALTGAADAQTVTEPAEEATVGTDDVVVTAEKRAERSGDVPFALSVVTGEQLERLQLRTYRDLSYYTPGLFAEAESPGRPFIAIRGIATNVVDAASEPRVSVFQDGISNSRLQSSLTELFDIQRIEVVKGPQSTLFGRSALIGAVSIISNRADPDTTSLAVTGEGGNFGERRVELIGNVPIDATTAFRLAAQVRHRNGYVDNLGGGPDFNGFTTAAARGSLHFAPTSALQVDLIGNYEHARDTGVSYKSGTFYPNDPATGTILGDLDARHGATLALSPNFALGGRLGGERDSYGATLLAEWRLSDRFTLSSTGGYRGFRLTNRFDYDGFALQVIAGGEQTRGDQFSQELRLGFDGGDRFHAFVGGSFFNEKVDRNSVFSIGEPLFLALLTRALDVRNPVLKPQAAYADPAATAAIIRGLVGSVGGSLSATRAAAIAANFSALRQEGYRNRDTTTAEDLFADASFAPFPRLQLQAGVRVTIGRKLARYASIVPERSVLTGVLAAIRLPAAQRDGLLAALAAPGAATIPFSAAYPVPVFGVASQPTGGEDSRLVRDTGVSWRVNARYSVSDTANAYLSYARGRRPKVTSAAAPLTPGGKTIFSDLSPETVDSVEGGVKLRTPGGRLRFDASAYAYRYRNFQTVVGVNGRALAVDAGKARAHGVEVEARWKATSWASPFATYAWNHARFASGLYAGNHFRLSPDHSASAGVEFDRGAVQATPSVTYRSRAYFDDTNGDPVLIAGGLLPVYQYRAFQSGYALANLQLAYAPPRARWRVEAGVQNLFDRSYLRDTGQASLAFGLPSYIAAPPRTVTLAFSIRN